MENPILCTGYLLLVASMAALALILICITLIIIHKEQSKET